LPKGISEYPVVSGSFLPRRHSRASGNPDLGRPGFKPDFPDVFSFFVALAPLDPRLRGDDEKEGFTTTMKIFTGNGSNPLDWYPGKRIAP
jgi:hypothetical protein